MSIFTAPTLALLTSAAYFLSAEIKPGDVMVIRYEGSKGGPGTL
ncbi:MAG TPA: hypothetical protein VKB05_03830 [Pyrinomonadaceae bacterium]|nr:hypothetical protein [Pyrinomonadaceae bacterium]